MNEQIQSMLLKVAEKLGTTAEHLWEVLVKQAQIKGYCDIFWIILLPVLFWIWYKAARYVQINSDNDKHDEGVTFFATVGLVIAAGVLIILSIWTVCDLPITIACFVNPEYVALKSLLEMLKSVK
jgi:hypothetical protein